MPFALSTSGRYGRPSLEFSSLLNGGAEVQPEAGVRRAAAGPASRAPTSGRAFSIDDALLAMRWANLVRDRGYRLNFSHAFRDADEVLEIHLPPHDAPVARVHRGHHVIWLTDRIGHSRVFTTLAGALLATAPLSANERRIMLKDGAPSWLRFPGQAASPMPGSFPRLLRTVMRWLARERNRPPAKAPLRRDPDDPAAIIIGREGCAWVMEEDEAHAGEMKGRAPI